MALCFGLPEWIILAATACILLYLYASRNRNYWKNQNVVYEPLALFFGTSMQSLSKPIHEIDTARYNQYGKLFGTFETGKAALFIGDPELVKQVMVKDFSSLPNRRAITFNDPLLDNMMSLAPVELWRKIRPAASPAFSTGKLRKMNYLIEDCAVVTAEHLKQAALKEEVIDVKQFFGNYALDVIARCAFATKLDSHSDQTNEFVTKIREAFSGRITLSALFCYFFPAISRLLGIRGFNSDVFRYFKQICQDIIKKRKDEHIRQEDFLQLMMDAQDAKLENTTEDTSNRDEQLFNLGSDSSTDVAFSSSKTLTEDEAMAQCVLFFLAGQDTTATVIAYTLYLLAIHPDAQEKLREEVDECFSNHGDHPNLDTVTKLKYLHCVVSESLRMYPPGPRIERSSLQDYTLGDTGVTVKKEDLVVIPVYAMHHDPQYFENPLTFNPERFNEANMASIRPYTYLPFGAGPRNCIGMRFALQAVKLSLLHTIRNVQVVPTEKTMIPLEFQSGFGALEAKNVNLRFRKRD